MAGHSNPAPALHRPIPRRHSARLVPWVAQLIRLVPELNGGMLPDHSVVWEEMNLAWAVHEIIGDFATAAFAWFDSG